ncbi:MAG TPA: 3'-5' exonuclease [Wenzhouxiangella sp.]|nr:3'-5' exonuclease [Wenzhouxiangella sp.]
MKRGWFRRSDVRQQDWPARMQGLAGDSRNEALARFYQGPWPAADTPMEGVQMAALDLETTGLDWRRHAIVSIGIVPFTLDRIRPSKGFYRLVKPRRKLEARSVTIHRITHARLADAPDLAEIADELLAALAGRVAVVHYRAIERRFLHQAFRLRFGEGLLFPLIDTMEIERRVLRRQRRLAWFSPPARRRQQSLRLADVRRRYGLPEYSPHHALTDALATAELLQAQVAHHGHRDDAVSAWWQ